MKKLLSLGIAAAALALTCAAFAYPTLTGPTGLVLQPSTSVVGAGALDVAVDFLLTKRDPEPTDTEAIRVLYGVIPGLELGAAWLPEGDVSTWDINAKYKFPIEWEKFQLALGADGGSVMHPNGSGGTKSDGIYDVTLVTSYPLVEKMLKVDLGVTASGRPVGEESGTKTIAGVTGFLGADLMLPYGLSVVGDVSTISHALQTPTLPVGLAVRFAPEEIKGLTIQAGCENMGTYSNQYSFLVGAGYCFGGGEEKEMKNDTMMKK